MADDDLDIHRKDPPETTEEWQRLHRSAWRADQTWLIARPIVAFVSNWKAVVACGLVVAWFNRPGIMEAFSVIFGGGK